MKLNIKKFVSNDKLFLVVARIFEGAMGYATLLVISNYYGNSRTGIFSEITAYFYLSTILLNFGLSNYILRNVAKVESYQEAIRILKSSLIINIKFVFISILFFLIISNFIFTYKFIFELNLVIISIPFFLINKNILVFYNGIRNYKVFATLRIARFLVFFLIVFSFAILKLNFIYLFLSFLFSEIFLILLNFRLILRILSIENQRINFNDIIFSIKTLLSEIITTSTDKLIIIILSFLLSSYELGIYNLIISLASVVIYFQSVISQYFDPIVSNYYNNKKESELNLKIKNVFKVIIILNFIIMIFVYAIFYVIYFFNINKTLFIYNKEFLYVLFSYFILGSISWTGGFLIMGGFVNQNLIRVSFLFLINIIFTYLLTYLLKLEGAFLSVALFNLVVFIVQLFSLKKVMKLEFSIR